MKIAGMGFHTEMNKPLNCIITDMRFEDGTVEQPRSTDKAKPYVPGKKRTACAAACFTPALSGAGKRQRGSDAQRRHSGISGAGPCAGCNPPRRYKQGIFHRRHLCHRI